MSDPATQLVKAHLKQLRPPAMGQELEKLSRDAAASNQDYEQFLLRLTEAELAARATNALEARIKQAAFPVAKDFDTHDFSVMPSLSRPRLLELAMGEWIDQKYNCCFVGNPGTGKTHLATNVIQESLIREGLSGTATTGRKVTTKAVKSVTGDLAINRELWWLADEMAKLA